MWEPLALGNGHEGPPSSSQNGSEQSRMAFGKRAQTVVSFSYMFSWDCYTIIINPRVYRHAMFTNLSHPGSPVSCCNQRRKKSNLI